MATLRKQQKQYQQKQQHQQHQQQPYKNKKIDRIKEKRFSNQLQIIKRETFCHCCRQQRKHFYNSYGNNIIKNHIKTQFESIINCNHNYNNNNNNNNSSNNKNNNSHKIINNIKIVNFFLQIFWLNTTNQWQKKCIQMRTCYVKDFMILLSLIKKYILIKFLTDWISIIGFILIILSNAVRSQELHDFQKNIPARLVWAAIGKSVDLPCDLTPPSPQDSVKLLLWFKDTTGIPLYSLDSRAGNIKIAPHSAIASDLGQRLFFSIGDNPKDSKLQIRHVKSTDGGIYRCRVDFFNFPTRNYRLNLTLVVPPEEPRIFDAQGKEISHMAGPFREGYELFLCCQVKGGRPLPKVTWWKGANELIGTSHTSIEEGITIIVNQLLISVTTREFFGSKIQCRAQGSKLIEPVTKEVMVQVHLKPLRVKIITPNELLTAGHPVPLRCETWGSYPAAKISWLLDGEPIRNAEVTIHNDKENLNLTISILMLKVSSENNNAELTCRASNPWFSGSLIEDKRIIRVAYPPTVSVHLANEDPSRIVIRAEGQNVTFKCRADARPPVTSYSWFKNGMRISGEYVEIMHLTKLERESAGAYACGALNTEGETRSSSITLQIQYSPRCKQGTEQTSIGAVNMRTIPIKCEVEANPADSIKFSWTYNNTRNVSPVLNSRIQSSGTISTVTYLPQTDSELITLACWASNAVGRQAVPCLIHILPANPPETPKSCELRNDTVLEVICIPGNDGGLSQYFILEVIGGELAENTDLLHNFGDIINSMDSEVSTMNDQATTAPLFRLQESKPQFRLNNLEPGREYQFVIYAVNAKGRSDPPLVIDRIKVNAQSKLYDDFFLSEDPTPAGTTHHISSNAGVILNDVGATLSATHEQQSAVLLLIGVVVISTTIITTIIVTSLIIVCRNRPRPPQPQDVRKNMRPMRNDVPSMYIDEDDLNDDESNVGCTNNRTILMHPRLMPSCHNLRRSTTTLNSQHYAPSDGFVQYAQPSLNDPDLILPRGELEFTVMNTR